MNRHLLAYFNGDYRRDGAKIESSSAGDALFPGLEPIFREGKRVEVERKGAAA